LTHVDSGLERLALYDTSDKASSESITGTIGVVDLVLADSVYCDLLDIYTTAVLCTNGNGRISALGEDYCPRALGVLLGAVRNGLGNLLDILGVDVVRLGERGGFSLIANEDVDVRQDLVERVLEELRDEGCGEVKNEGLRKLVPAIYQFASTVRAYLVLRSSLLGKRLDGWYTNGQVEATDVEDLRILDLLPDAVLLQVLDLVVVGSRQVGAERTVVAGDDDTAATSGRLLVVQVLSLDACVARDLLEGLAVLVLANAADVDGRVGLEHVLCTSRCVLGGTAGDEDGFVVLDQVLVEAHVLLRVGKNGIVGLEAILVEQCLVAVHSKVSMGPSRCVLFTSMFACCALDLPNTLDV
jgi:hypothetical protein